MHVPHLRVVLPALIHQEARLPGQPTEARQGVASLRGQHQGHALDGKKSVNGKRRGLFVSSTRQNSELRGNASQQPPEEYDVRLRGRKEGWNVRAQTARPLTTRSFEILRRGV